MCLVRQGMQCGITTQKLPFLKFTASLHLVTASPLDATYTILLVWGTSEIRRRLDEMRELLLPLAFN